MQSYEATQLLPQGVVRWVSDFPSFPFAVLVPWRSPFASCFAAVPFAVVISRRHHLRFLFRGRHHLQFMFRGRHHLRNTENLFHGCKAGLRASPIRRLYCLAHLPKAHSPRKCARKALDAFGCQVRVLVGPSSNRALDGLVAPVAAQPESGGKPLDSGGPIDDNEGSA